ncbi:TetR/AcrR family transcriptional regulator [Cellulosimicrobium cellulans]|uniref:TetR/AcrR family transcriptional regulator n=1 Tax=Cellulosimicrobium cellulans TaxID=1710 RepID=UPI0008491606|nr:TetR/AcrR family transcriptional regulator [Cellulosimicrobium cellulans]
MAIRATTEAKLLDAADELFFSRGIAATSVDAVLERAGVSPATLYRGYASKEALLAAALERRHRAWLDTWDDAVAAQGTPEGRLLAVFDALDAFRTRPVGSRWCAFLGSAAEYADPPAEVERAIRTDTETMRARLAALAAAVDPERGDALADELLLVVTGYLAMRLRRPAETTGTARRVAQALVAAR